MLLEHPRRPVAEELGDVVKAQPAVVERRRRLISGAALLGHAVFRVMGQQSD